MKYINVNSYKYEVCQDFAINISEFKESKIITKYFELSDGSLIIRKSYMWDGASGPTIDTKNTMIGSLVHDVLYQCIREGYISKNKRLLADRVLYRLLVKNGMSKFRASYWKLGLRLFGSFAAKLKKTEEQDIVYEV